MSKARKRASGTVHAIPTGWRETLLICRKCSRKLGGGFGTDGRENLRQVLRETLRQRGQRGTVGLIEVRCLGICPKHAVTVAIGSLPGELLTVGQGASADSVLDRLKQ